ncbi:MAG TPA: PLD nuclease N-terminal domain-containing protein [Streptosporangiaceae bacterium]|nr:PLD nuclease N-terminal domain-containing protein [Streptosporangiaceae bacterium]
MLLLGAVFALFIAGFWVYCVADVALTPRYECRRLPKAAWLVVVAAIPVIGAVVWLAAGRPGQPAIAPPAAPPTGPPPVSGSGGGTGEDGGHPGNERPRPADEPGARDVARRSRPGPGRPARPRGPRGPDDDPDFLRSLDRAIHGADAGDDPALG